MNLVSIIIPTYNRAHLIGETLDSVIAQSYSNWECIVVDDGSTDNTHEVLKNYCSKDLRINFFKRSENYLPGGNGARNFGLDKSKGDFVIFFDSDDLMTSDHVSLKLKPLKYDVNLDFSISKTKFFNSDDSYLESYYKFDKFPITEYNYVAQKINWLTYDICLRGHIARAIRFNENLKSGQEYNYFCKLVLITTRGLFQNKILTLRRKHDNSIRGNLTNKRDLMISYFKSSFVTYLDTKAKASVSSKNELLKRCLFIVSDIKISSFRFYFELLKFYGLFSFNIYLFLFCDNFNLKGRYFFSQRLKRKFKEYASNE